MSDVKSTFDGPRLQYADHDQMQARFDIDVRQANLGNHWEATIQVPGPNGAKFVARHESKTQAIADVKSAVQDARKRGTVIPGIR